MGDKGEVAPLGLKLHFGPLLELGGWFTHWTWAAEIVEMMMD